MESQDVGRPLQGCRERAGLLLYLDSLFLADAQHNHQYYPVRQRRPRLDDGNPLRNFGDNHRLRQRFCNRQQEQQSDEGPLVLPHVLGIEAEEQLKRC